MDLIADTSLLVGLWRRQPWAVRFARSHSSQSLGLPWVVLGEFWHGALRAGHPADEVRAFLSIGLPILDTTETVPVYAELAAATQTSPEYRKIGQNDLWIAAVAVALRKPLVTKNSRHFQVIEGLRLEVVG